MTKHVLITGGSGFIGSAIATHLVNRGYRVSNLDLVAKDMAGVEFIKGDIRDREMLEEIFPKQVDGVIHMAAITSVLQSKKDPAAVFTTNLEATSYLLELCRTRGVNTFHLASSNAVFGSILPTSRIETAESDTTFNEELSLYPLTPYGATKAAAEMLGAAYCESYGIKFGALRLTNVYGTNMGGKDSIVPRIMRSILNGSTIEVYGDGLQWRDYVYIDDVVNAFTLALEDEWTGPTIIGSGTSYSVLDLISAVEKATGANVHVRHGESKGGEMRGVRVDISLARSKGFEPKFTIEMGLASVYRDFLEHEAK
ncbi:MAG: NAD-dependent epimerase/dehydratase family protein [Actinomycetota bacterium]|nr:NAD-dependent epimerase/dehydratase family protein [Actinomycetota bacterium]